MPSMTKAGYVPQQTTQKKPPKKQSGKKKRRKKSGPGAAAIVSLVIFLLACLIGAGTIYVYLCYGMHWMLNIVTGETDEPEAVLIRACLEKNGPGKLTKALQITGNLNRGSILGDELWVEDDGFACQVVTDKRVGIGYASQEDQNRLWRFKMELSNRPV